MMHYYGYPLMYSMHNFGWDFIFNMLIGIGIIILVLAFVRGSGEKSEDIQSDKWVGILKERYAKGEINKKEYEDMKKELE